MSKLSQYLSGVKISLPVILGYLPVAIAFAVMASEAGLSRLEIILMSTLVFAGGSQIMAIGMITSGATMLSVVIGTFVFNLRHVIMGSYIMKKVGKTSTAQKLTTANGITDESFAIISAAAVKLPSATSAMKLGMLMLTGHAATQRGFLQLRHLEASS